MSRPPPQRPQTLDPFHRFYPLKLIRQYESPWHRPEPVGWRLPLLRSHSQDLIGMSPRHGYRPEPGGRRLPLLRSHSQDLIGMSPRHGYRPEPVGRRLPFVPDPEQQQIPPHPQTMAPPLAAAVPPAAVPVFLGRPDKHEYRKSRVLSGTASVIISSCFTDQLRSSLPQPEARSGSAVHPDR